MLETIYWKNNRVFILDQTILPEKEIYLRCSRYEEVAEAIKTMKVRGAPAIGITAGMGIALGMLALKTQNGPPRAKKEKFFQQLFYIGGEFARTRPTAVNLFWAIERMKKCALANKDLPLKKIQDELIKEADKIKQEDIALNKKMGDYGAGLFKKKSTVLTHCNAGSLATGGYGTALGVIRSLWKKGKLKEVYVDETRPFFQGARLTAWELKKENIPFRLICDNMAGYFLHQGKIDGVIVGADRVAANGDTANKIGTYSLSVLARENKVPFYVAVPTSTLDLKLKTGKDIPIEERKPEEVTAILGKKVPQGIMVCNPAFDVTPSRYITAFITERGVVEPQGIRRLQG